jgi:hypothetical protein
MVSNVPLTNTIADAYYAGYRVAQVRLIFRLICRNRSHPLHEKPLLYVQWFSKPADTAEDEIEMYLVERSLDSTNGKRIGSIIAQSSVLRFAHLVPRFGSNVDKSLTADNSIERAHVFYVNSFADKEIYKAVY